MRIVLLGAPGSGKGTQGEMLSMEYRIPKISTGDALRAAVSAESPVGLKARAAMDAGQLVSDAIVIEIVQARLGQPDAAEGFILDGFPRNLAQAQVLDELLRAGGQHGLDQVIHLQVDAAEIVARLLERGRQLGRSDDNEQTVARRLAVYAAETQPLLDYYGSRGLLVTLPGEGEIPQIYGRLTQALRAFGDAA